MPPRPELVTVGDLTVDHLRADSMASAEARGIARARFLGPGGHPTLAAAFAMARPSALAGRGWASVRIESWPCRAAQREDMEPLARVATADAATLVNELVMDIAPTAPVKRGQVAHAVVRQLIVNALVHRSFAGDAADEPIAVECWTDGFEVRNPAVHGVSPNPLLHALLAARGLAAQTGTGLRYVRRSARLVGWRATCATDGDHFVASVHVDLESIDAAEDGASRQRVAGTDAEQLVLVQLQLGRTPKTRTELVQTTGLPPSTVMAVLRRLERDGSVRATQPGRRSRFQAYSLRRS